MSIEHPAPPPPEPPLRPRRRAWPWAVAAGGLGVAAGVAITVAAMLPANSPTGAKPSTPAGSATFTMLGNLRLSNLSTGGPAGVQQLDYGRCLGAGGYSDLTTGAAVTVADPLGHVVATGYINTGYPETTVMSAPALGLGPTTMVVACNISFTVPDVPEGLTSYSVTVTHRGTQVVQPDEAHQKVNLTIGS